MCVDFVFSCLENLFWLRKYKIREVTTQNIVENLLAIIVGPPVPAIITKKAKNKSSLASLLLVL